MKKWIVLLLLLAAVSGGLFAQKHSVSVGLDAGVGLPILFYMGANTSYEFRIIPQLSVGINAFWEFFPMALFAVVFTNDPDHLVAYGFEGQVHWYPFSKVFHVDAGLGWGYYMGMNTLLIAPGVGWKIDFGKPGGFFINPCVRLEIFKPVEKNIFKSSDQNAELIPGNLAISINAGYSF